MYDCLIIGGGLAGLTAAIYTARAGLSTAVIEGEQCGGQAVMADLVENYPGFIGSGYELAEKTEQQAENVGVEIIYDEIESVDFKGKVKKAIGFENSYEGKFVIVATGAKHKRAGFQGEEDFTGDGVSYCAVCDGAFFTDMEVAVIGGATYCTRITPQSLLPLENLLSCALLHLQIFPRNCFQKRPIFTFPLKSTDSISSYIIFNTDIFRPVCSVFFSKLISTAYKTRVIFN